MTTDRQADLHARIDTELTNVAPAPETLDRMIGLRAQAQALGHLAVDLVPEGRELSLFITTLDESLRWAIAGLARNQADLPVLNEGQQGNLAKLVENFLGAHPDAALREDQVSDAGHDEDTPG